MAAFACYLFNLALCPLAPWPTENLAFLDEAMAGLMSALLRLCCHLHPFPPLDARFDPDPKVVESGAIFDWSIVSLMQEFDPEVQG
jgi:hypothetical protein